MLQHKVIEDVLTDDWNDLRDAFLAIMEPPMRQIFDAGIAYALSVDVPGYVARKDFLDADPAALDDVAGALFRTYTDSWWAGLEDTTRSGLRDAILNHATAPDVEAIISEIEPLFGPTRARRIGVTETTRLFGEGARLAYRESGVPGWRWLTVEDDRVCPECDALSGSVYDIGVPFLPAHVSCRCFPSPVMDIGAA